MWMSPITDEQSDLCPYCEDRLHPIKVGKESQMKVQKKHRTNAVKMAIKKGIETWRRKRKEMKKENES